MQIRFSFSRKLIMRSQVTLTHYFLVLSLRSRYDTCVCQKYTAIINYAMIIYLPTVHYAHLVTDPLIGLMLGQEFTSGSSFSKLGSMFAFG
jgi:hypothetical protein